MFANGNLPLPEILIFLKVRFFFSDHFGEPKLPLASSAAYDGSDNVNKA